MQNKYTGYKTWRHGSAKQEKQEKLAESQTSRFAIFLQARSHTRTRGLERETLTAERLPGVIMQVTSRKNHLYNINTTSAQRLRRWPNIV